MAALTVRRRSVRVNDFWQVLHHRVVAAPLEQRCVAMAGALLTLDGMEWLLIGSLRSRS